MTIFILAVVVASVIEIRMLIKRKQKKEAFVFATLAAIAIVLGVLHFNSPYKISIANYVLNLMGLKE